MREKGFRKVKINIGHTFYFISTDLSDEEIEWLSKYISSKVLELESKTGLTDPEKIFLFTSLNIAEELMNLLKKYGELKKELNELKEKIYNSIEEDQKQEDNVKEDDVTKKGEV